MIEHILEARAEFIHSFLEGLKAINKYFSDFWPLPMIVSITFISITYCICSILCSGNVMAKIYFIFIRLYGTLNSVEQEKGFIESIVSFPFSWCFTILRGWDQIAVKWNWNENQTCCYTHIWQRKILYASSCYYMLLLGLWTYLHFSKSSFQIIQIWYADDVILNVLKLN